MTAQTGDRLWKETLVPGPGEFTVHGKHQGIREFVGKCSRYKVKETSVLISIGEQESPTIKRA